MVKYEFRAYEQVSDRRHHFDVFEDGELTQEYIYEDDVWENQKTKEIVAGNEEDLIQNTVIGDLDEYEIEENSAYGVKYTYWTPKD